MVTPAPNGENWRDLTRHWLRFNTVGALGVVVQLLVLMGLIDGLGLNYLLATLVAVEAAILHNFTWHECWTWSDRTRQRPGDFMVRLLRFNVVTGLTSILGNLVLMRLFVGSFRLHYLAANLLSIALCYVLNFTASEWFVFKIRRTENPPAPPAAESCEPKAGSPR